MRDAFLAAASEMALQASDAPAEQPQPGQQHTAATLAVKAARQSSIHNFFSTVPTPNLAIRSIPAAEQASDDMECTIPEAERKRKREQRDQDHDSADDKLEKISKATTETKIPELLDYSGTISQASSQEEIPTQFTDTLTWDN